MFLVLILSFKCVNKRLLNWCFVVILALFLVAGMQLVVVSGKQCVVL